MYYLDLLRDDFDMSLIQLLCVEHDKIKTGPELSELIRRRNATKVFRESKGHQGPKTPDKLGLGLRRLAVEGSQPWGSRTGAMRDPSRVP